MKITEKRVFALAKKLGLKAELIDLREQHAEPFSRQYTADKLVRAYTLSSLVHEIAHYLVAPRNRKKMENFGLGSAPDEFRRYGRPHVSYLKADEEEAHASLLGILIEKHIGMKWKQTWREHNWGDQTDGVRESMVRAKLRRRKLLDKNDKPTCLK